MAEVLVAELGDDEAERIVQPCRDERPVAPAQVWWWVLPTEQDRLGGAGHALKIEHNLPRIELGEDLGVARSVLRRRRA